MRSIVRYPLIAVAALLLLVAACGGDDDGANGVASLAESTTTTVAEASAVTGEQSLFEFAQCMRDNGVDVPDPIVDADGNVGFSQDADPTLFQSDEAQEAFDACRDFLDLNTLGFGEIDLTELTDDLLAFAQCMRDNDYDLPDPDFSNFELAPPNAEGEVNTPFGVIDLDDPEFEAALEVCEGTLPGFLQGGGPGAG